MSERPCEHGVAWQLEWRGRPASTINTAHRAAAELGSVIVPVEPDDAEAGIWLCDTDADLFDTLTEVGWAGLDNGGNATAEATWPL